MRIGIFVDGVYLFKGLNGKRLQFDSFKKWLCKTEFVTVSKYFNSMHNDTKKRLFMTHVAESGYDLHVREPFYSLSRGQYYNIGIDVELAIEAMSNIDKYDSIIIVSGSRDYLPLCEKLTLNNKNVTIVGFKHTIHKLLHKYNIRYIEDFL